MVKYELKNGEILKDGHTMFQQDIVKDLNRKAYLDEHIRSDEKCFKCGNERHTLYPNRGQESGLEEMRLYIGCKLIKARPMDEDSFRASQGKQMTPGRNAAGYMVLYPDGYISWSPKETFEKAYRLINDKEQAMMCEEIN